MDITSGQVTVFSGVTPAKYDDVGGLAGVDLAKSTPANQKFRVKILSYEYYDNFK
jgi:hypothetical protein